MRNNTTMEYPQEFLALWDGCAHLDCLPECRHGLEGGHCERLERAYADYLEGAERMDNGRNTGGKSYLRVVDR